MHRTNDFEIQFLLSIFSSFCINSIFTCFGIVFLLTRKPIARSSWRVQLYNVNIERNFSHAAAKVQLKLIKMSKKETKKVTAKYNFRFPAMFFPSLFCILFRPLFSGLRLISFSASQSDAWAVVFSTNKAKKHMENVVGKVLVFDIAKMFASRRKCNRFIRECSSLSLFSNWKIRNAASCFCPN